MKIPESLMYAKLHPDPVLLEEVHPMGRLLLTLLWDPSSAFPPHPFLGSSGWHHSWLASLLVDAHIRVIRVLPCLCPVSHLFFLNAYLWGGARIRSRDEDIQVDNSFTGEFFKH